MSAPVSIVTGAASGIGRACVEKFASLGHRVVLVDRNRDALEAFADELSGGDAVRILALDVCSEEDMQAMAEETVTAFGRIDHLVASAGILRAGGRLSAVADTSLGDWRAVIDINLTGVFLANRAVLPVMTRQREGEIVNISSVSGRQGRAFDGAYCASKFGIIGLSESLAEEVSAFGVRVQTLLPDAVDTPLWEQNGPAGGRASNALPPERIADFVHFMLTLPRDAFLLNPTIAAFKTRKRRKKSDAGSSGE